MKSRIFLPILSRNAINNDNNTRSNFRKLTKYSKCDNVLLEYNLALELRERGLIELVYPVMIGDKVIDLEAQKTLDVTNNSISNKDDEDFLNDNNDFYGNYFRNGCHPNLSDITFVPEANMNKVNEHLVSVICMYTLCHICIYIFAYMHVNY